MNSNSKPRRHITVQSSGQRARQDLQVAGVTRQAQIAPPGRSFSYSSY